MAHRKVYLCEEEDRLEGLEDEPFFFGTNLFLNLYFLNLSEKKDHANAASYDIPKQLINHRTSLPTTPPPQKSLGVYKYTRTNYLYRTLF